MKTIDIAFENKSYPVVYTLTAMVDNSTLFNVVVKDDEIAKYIGDEFNFTLSKDQLVLTAEMDGETEEQLRYDIIRKILVNEDTSFLNG